MGEVKCEYCSSMIDDQLEKCPNCGGTNVNLRRTVTGTPKTIAELEQWYKDRNLPPYETTRFFIGMDYKQPKAFGIYQDGDRYIVYKNKDNGERAIRYEGTDEAYAVNELYMRLKSEIINQKEHNQAKRAGNTSASSSGSSGNKSASILMWIAIALIIIVPFSRAIREEAHTGYYSVGNNSYYYDGGLDTWYNYDLYYNDWYRCDQPVTQDSVWEYQDNNFESNWTGEKATDSAAYQADYQAHQESSSDSDSDWSSSDSWDSDSTDWGSDW